MKIKNLPVPKINSPDKVKKLWIATYIDFDDFDLVDAATFNKKPTADELKPNVNSVLVSLVEVTL